jgi:hypothetical protein
MSKRRRTENFYRQNHTGGRGHVDRRYVPRQPRFFLVVENGAGDGEFKGGATCPIVADSPPTDYRFNAWSGEVVADSAAASTSLVMPRRNAHVTANFVPVTPPPWDPNPHWGDWTGQTVNTGQIVSRLYLWGDDIDSRLASGNYDWSAATWGKYRYNATTILDGSPWIGSYEWRSYYNYPPYVTANVPYGVNSVVAWDVNVFGWDLNQQDPPRLTTPERWFSNCLLDLRGATQAMHLRFYEVASDWFPGGATVYPGAYLPHDPFPRPLFRRLFVEETEGHFYTLTDDANSHPHNAATDSLTVDVGSVFELSAPGNGVVTLSLT